MQLETLTMEETAAAIGYATVRTFQNNLRRLIERDGFPARLPSGKWYAPAVRLWLARVSGMDDQVSAEISPIVLQRNLLEAHYQKGKAA